VTDQKSFTDLPADQERAVEPSLTEAQQAFEVFISEKFKSYAAQNISAALEFVRLLNEAKTFQDVIQIQTEFMQAQLRSFGEQAREFSEIYTKAGAKVLNMPFHMSS
jgi:hypothetical protein